MELKSKKVLIINLSTKEAETKNFPDFHKYIGGMALGLKLFQQYQEKDPLIFSVGPLNGFFPYASKTSIVLNNAGVLEDIYIGGTLSTRIRFMGLDSMVIIGESPNGTVLDILNKEVKFRDISNIEVGGLGLPGKRSILDYQDNKISLDGYFTTSGQLLEEKMLRKGLKTISFTGTEQLHPLDYAKYNALYKEILNRKSDMTIKNSDKPSCSNCPMGCEKSKSGEIGGNVLLHSLVACQYSERIYSDIGIAFSCLNILGYDYTHEDLEALPELVESLLKSLN